MNRFGGVEEDAGEAEAVQRCHELLSNAAALSYTADDDFAPIANSARNELNTLCKRGLSGPIGPVEILEILQGASLGR